MQINYPRITSYFLQQEALPKAEKRQRRMNGPSEVSQFGLFIALLFGLLRI
jgi:hypothetical protein